MGWKAKDFRLIGVDGKVYSLDSFSEAKVLVIIFMCNHCPYVQAIWGRLVALQAEFSHKKVQFVGINPNTANLEYEEETLEKMAQYSEKYQMNFPYLEDGDQKVAEFYQAQCTPDIYVFDDERKLAYHGRLDDSWKDEEAVTKRELAEAIQLILKGEAVGDQKPSMGCSIKWV